MRFLGSFGAAEQKPENNGGDLWIQPLRLLDERVATRSRVCVATQS